MDDATGRILNAQLWPAESTKAVLTALFAIFEFLPRHNEEFACPARDPELSFVGVGEDELLQAFCLEQVRTVQRDNTVSVGRKILQIPKQPGRANCVGLTVTVRRYLDWQHAIFSGKRLMGFYDAQGHLIPKEVALGGVLASACGLRSRAA